MLFYLFPLFFFFNDTATTEIYTLSLHDALPICRRDDVGVRERAGVDACGDQAGDVGHVDEQERPDAVGDLGDRKSTRLNSSHGYISYAVFCLKKKKKKKIKISIECKNLKQTTLI